MRVFITGATGLVGRALVQRLLGLGHQVTALVRSETRGRGLLGTQVELALGGQAIRAEVGRAEAIVNLAGEPIFGGRWSASRRAAIRDSRLATTDAIITAIEIAAARPRVLVSASAVGYYGDRGDQFLEDNSKPGGDFLADLCRDWEGSALHARQLGVRVVIPRFGIVLGLDGGVLGRLIPVFRLGAGGRIGSGRQFIAWIHIRDLVELIVRALEDPSFEGRFIAAAPYPVTNAEFTRELSAMLERPKFLTVPAAPLKLLLGQAASVLLGGQRAVPGRLEEWGFRFRYERLRDALSNLLFEDQPELRALHGGDDVPDAPYLRRRPRFLLRQSARVDQPIDALWNFFSRPENLGVMTPATLGFEMSGEMPRQLAAGTNIDYRLKLGPVPIRWRTHIERWQPQDGFVDSQARGPYRVWWHEHGFHREDDATAMEDRVYYDLPLGVGGGVLNRFLVAPMLGDIFRYRRQVLALRFSK